MLKLRTIIIIIKLQRYLYEQKSFRHFLTLDRFYFDSFVKPPIPASSIPFFTFTIISNHCCQCSSDMQGCWIDVEQRHRSL
jgi:hypothetical protein